MRVLSSTFLLLALLAVPAAAQTWYARGEFNGWGLDNPMVVDPGDSTHFTANLTGLFENSPYNWKVANDNWSIEMPGIGPGNDARAYSDASGNLTLHMYNQTTWNDGYLPNNTRRVGYDDTHNFGWEIVGSFNGWPGAPDPVYQLTDMGNGLYTGTFNMPAGGQAFKFRGLTATQWDTSIGQYFRNSANDNTFLVGTAGDPWTFELDLPKGRFRYFTTATPAGQQGDFNKNGIVDAADYTVYRDNVGSTTALPNDSSGTPVGTASYDNWKAHFGQGTLITWMARHTPTGAQTQIPDTNFTNLGSGNYELNLTGLTPGDNYDFRSLKTDLSAALPGTVMRVRADASGNIGLKFYELQSASWGDGWSPSTSHRLGYVDPQQFGWDVIGSFNGWSAPLLSLAAQGNGVYAGDYTFDTPGNYAFKFRHQDETNPWNISIGEDFGNNAGNAQMSVASAGQTWRFELDLPNGRWRVFQTNLAASGVPEPGSLLLLMLGICGVAAVGGRRR